MASDMADAEPDEVSATLALQEAVSLWRLSGAMQIAEVIDAATECLVVGLDSPSLRILAGASPRESMFELEPLTLASLEELGNAQLLQTNIQREALRALSRRFRRGAISARDLAAWAHTHVGHDGPADCQPLVVLDDMYDEGEYLGYAIAELDRWTQLEAEALLDGLPSPGTTDRYGTPVPPVRRSTSRLPRWLSRRTT